MNSKSTPLNVTLTGLGTLTALAATAHAATVQITLTGNKISSTIAGGNTLNADITGDSFADLGFSSPVVNGHLAQVRINGGNIVYAGTDRSDYLVDAEFVAGGAGTGFAVGMSLQNIKYLNRITFTDSRINGGALTQAWLEVNSFNTSFSRHTVELTRVIFDNASTIRPTFESIPGTQTEFTIPEPSGLALLALGAGGLLTRRKRLAA